MRASIPSGIYQLPDGIFVMLNTFDDPDGIMDDVGKAMELVHVCIDHGLYRQGFALANLLSCVTVSVEGAYLDYDDGSMDLETLNAHDLLEDDVYKLFLKETIYLCYLVSSSGERAEEILRLIGNLHYHSFKLEEVMQMGNGDLPDFSAFLQDWIRVLTTGSGGQFERMLQDALSMIQDEKSALEVAKQNILTHPVLLEKLIHQGENYGKGMQAMLSRARDACGFDIRNTIGALLWRLQWFI